MTAAAAAPRTWLLNSLTASETVHPGRVASLSEGLYINSHSHSQSSPVILKNYNHTEQFCIVQFTACADMLILLIFSN